MKKFLQQTDGAVTKTIKPKKVFYTSVEDFLKKYHWYENNRGMEGGVDMDRVEDIAYDIAYNETDWMLMPAVVDVKTKTVLDGNTSGRAQVMANQEYGVDLQILVIEVELPKGLSVHKAVRIFNNERINWSLIQIIKNEIQEGNKDYIRLDMMARALGEFFMDDYGKPRYRYASALAGASKQKELRSGEYTLSKKDMAAQSKLGEIVSRCWEAGGKPSVGPWAEGFVVALVKVANFMGAAFNAEKLVAAFEEEGYKLFDATTKTEVWKDRITKILTR